jgi:hypothetical protein
LPRRAVPLPRRAVPLPRRAVPLYRFESLTNHFLDQASCD